MLERERESWCALFNVCRERKRELERVRERKRELVGTIQCMHS